MPFEFRIRNLEFMKQFGELFNNNQSWLFLINIEFSSNKECLEMNPNKPICRQNNCQHECTHLVPCPGGKSCVDGRYKLVHVLLYDIFVPYFGWWKLSKQTSYWSKTGFFSQLKKWTVFSSQIIVISFQNIVQKDINKFYISI